MRDELKTPALIAVAALALGLGLAQLVNQEAGLRPPNVRAPEFPPPGMKVSGTEWIDSPPLTMAQLRGQVVLIDFWEYTCINCIRTFAANKLWYQRYHRYGFEIIGVHAPEFDIAYNVDNVRAAVKRFALPYPIVADDWYYIWKSYKNQGWPGRYLIDSQGYVRYARIGEGGDSEFERAIQQLLKQAHPGLKFPPQDAIAPDEPAFAPGCGVPTDEMYVGPWYGRGTLENHEGYHPGDTIDYKLPKSVDDGRTILGGRWETDQNGMIYSGKAQQPDQKAARLEMRYHARELYAVINVSHGLPSRLYIQQDGQWLTAEDKGVDVKLDDRGRSYIGIAEPRMYYLTANPRFGAHTVTLIPTAPGLTVNSFTFGNDCQTKFPHL